MNDSPETARNDKTRTRLWLFLAFVMGVILHIVFCAESPLVNTKWANSTNNWSVAIGYASVGIILSLFLGLGIKLIPGLRNLWLVPLVAGLYVGLIIRIASGSWAPSVGSYETKDTYLSEPRVTSLPEPLVTSNSGEFLYTPESGDFSILFPDKPSTTTISAEESGAGDVVLTVASKGSRLYQIDYREIGPDVLSYGRDVVLNGVIIELLTRLKATSTRERSFLVDGSYSRQVRAEARIDGMHVISDIRTILVGNRLYKLMVVSEAPLEESRSLAFFESFKIQE